jgi:signal transduction histidine kinase
VDKIEPDRQSELELLRQELSGATATISVLMDRLEMINGNSNAPTGINLENLALQELVRQRTLDLHQMNQGLVQAAAHRRKTDRILEKMQRISSIGGWELNVESGELETTGQILEPLRTASPPPRIESLCGMFVEKDSQLLRKHLAAAASSREPFDLELTTLPERGISRILRVVGQPLLEAASVSCIYGAVSDITEQKRIAELELERRGLQDAVKSLEQVLGIVGHELRTPLAGLRAMTDFLMEPTARGTPEWDRFLHSLGEEVIRMSDTVDSLLEAARLNSGRARWNWSKFKLEPICREVTEGVRMRMRNERVRVSYQLDSPGIFMQGDAGGLRRMLLNLVSNAWKFTESGEIQLRLRSESVDDEKWVELRVIDTGVGIAPDILSRVGDAFALNSGVVGENCVSGTGLGLAICKGIAAAHAGSLRIDSVLGQGTTVIVRLRADLPSPVVEAQPLPLLVGSNQTGSKSEAA